MWSKLTKFGRVRVGAAALTAAIGSTLPFTLPAFQQGASAQSSPSYSGMGCVSSNADFGDATPFTDYVAESATLYTSSSSYIQDTEGAIAVGGAVNFTVAPGKYFSVGIRLPSKYSSNPGLAGDSLVAPNGSGSPIVTAGNVWVGKTVGTVQSGGHLGSVNTTATESAPLNFAQTTQLLQNESNGIYGDSQSQASYSFDNANHTLTITSTAQPGAGSVVDIPDSLFSHTNMTVDVKAASGASVIINVTNFTNVTGGSDMSDVATVNASPKYTLWNFGQASSVKLAPTVQWRGTILAPYALLTGGAQIEGSVYVQRLKSIAETHLDLYQGCVPTNLFISKTSNPSSITSGQSSSYTINSSASGTVIGVTLTDPLMYAPGVNYQLLSFATTASNQTAWTNCSFVPPTSSTPGEVTCKYLGGEGGVTNPEFAPVVIGVTTAPSTPTTLLTNTATLSSPMQSVSSTAQITITPPPSLSIGKTVDGVTQITLPAPSLNNNYGLNVQGSGVFQGPITVNDQLPSYVGLSYGTPAVSRVISGLATSGCSISASNLLACSFSPSQSYLYVPSTQSLASITVPFSLSSSATLAGSFTNKASVSYGNSTMTSNVVTVNVNDPSLSITKSVDGSQSVTVTPPSTNHTFTLTPSGSGTFNTALVVSDSMPNYQGLSFGTPVISGLYSGFTESASSCTTPAPGQVMTCTFPLASGVSFIQVPATTPLVTITVPFSLSSSAPPGSFTNGGAGTTGTSVSSTGLTASSNVVTVNVNGTTPVAPSQQLTATLSKVAQVASVQPGGSDSFSITGTFSGTVSSPVTLSDPLPNYMTLDGTPSVTGSSFASSSCSGNNNVVTCIFTPNSGGSANPSIGTVVVPVLVSSSAPAGQITNTATLSDSGDGLTPISASATITVTSASVAPPVTAASSSGSSTTTPQATATSSLTVPPVHTGEPWSSRYWYVLVVLSAVLGGSLLVPWSRIRLRKR
jgi:hypothetical protein